MDRRRFLKGAGLTFAAGIAGLAGSTAAPLGRAPRGRQAVAVGASTRYRIDGGPLVYVSHDAGATWTRHSNLGERYSIESIRTDTLGRVRLIVAFDRRRFGLVLASNSRAWLTA